jgi:hypothetical protein
MLNKAKLNAEMLDKVRMGLVKGKHIETVTSSLINCFKDKKIKLQAPNTPVDFGKPSMNLW